MIKYTDKTVCQRAIGLGLHYVCGLTVHILVHVLTLAGYLKTTGTTAFEFTIM